MRPENIGGFTSPFEERRHVVDTVVDFESQSVSLTLPDGVTRVAKRYKNQGCVALPIAEGSVYFTPSDVPRNLPPAETTPWPMGDLLSEEPWPVEVDMTKVEEALDAGFGPPEARTLALLVSYKGRILGERYSDEVDIHTPLESWSMTKSLTGTLVGVLVQQGEYELWQPAPIPEWQTPGDPRQEIRIGDIMRMSSGLRIPGAAGPGLRSVDRIPRPRLSLYGDGELVRVRGHTSATVAAQHRRPLPEHRSGACELSGPARCGGPGGGTTMRSRSATCSTRSASATPSSKPTLTATSSARDVR